MSSNGRRAPTPAEITVRRSTAAYRDWVWSTLEGLRDADTDDFHRRRGLWKEFRDELLPAGALACKIDPATGIEFEPTLDDGPFDFRLYRHREPDGLLEVTSALDQNEHHRDRMLAENGRVLLSGPVDFAEVDGKRIAYIRQVTDSAEMIDWQIGTVLKVIEKKSRKAPLAGTDLLVGVPDDFRFTHFPWAERRLHDAVGECVGGLVLPYRSIVVIGVNSTRVSYQRRLAAG